MTFKRHPGRSLTVHSKRQSGITMWRGGAVSLSVRGHYFQIVLGDWWKAHPETARRRAFRRRAARSLAGIDAIKRERQDLGQPTEARW